MSSAAAAKQHTAVAAGATGASGRIGALRRHVRPGRLALLAVILLVAGEGIVLWRGGAGTSAVPQRGATGAVQRAVGTGGRAAGVPAHQEGAAPDAVSAPAAGRLAVRTEPAGATVIVDGKRRGVSPVEVEGLPPGEHQVLVRTRHGELRQQVRVGAGERLSLVVPLASVPTNAAPASPVAPTGFLVVRSPFELVVSEDGRVLGTSAAPPLPLPRGPHTLTLENASLGFAQSRTVSVPAGKTTTLSVDVTTQRVAINAVPWAEVWADGHRIGETPLGSVQLVVGPHSLVFRHPQLGEKRVAVVVNANEPARVSVNMKEQ